MQKHVFQIALASLIHNPSAPADWEKDVAGKLGKLPDGYSEIVELASKLCGGNKDAKAGKSQNLQSIFDHLSLSNKKEKTKNSHYFVPAALSLGDDLFFPRDQQELSEAESDTGSLLEVLKKELGWWRSQAGSGWIRSSPCW